MDYNKMQEVKREIYALRNGIVADALRKGGSPYRYIMGVNLPQLCEIAARHGYDATLASALRADTLSRESQLLAPLLTDPARLTEADGEAWLRGSSSREATDVLCLKLLRHHPAAMEMALACLADDVTDGAVRYGGIRLLWNLVATRAQEILPVAEREAAAGHDATSRLAAALADETRFVCQGDGGVSGA